MDNYTDDYRKLMLKTEYEHRENGKKYLDKDMDIQTWEEFDKVIYPTEKWFIKDLIPRGSFVIMAAPSGEKKSWLAMEMARCLASGSNFLNNDKFKTENAKVLYIEQETYSGEVQSRGRQLGLEKLGDQLHKLYKPANLNLNNDMMVSYLETLVREQKIEVIFIDTLRSVAGGLQEERADEVRSFFNRFSRLKESGKTIVFLDHCRKPSAMDGYVPKKEWLFGSQDKLASVEQLIMQRSRERSSEISVWVRKSKRGIEPAPFKILITDTPPIKINGITQTSFSFIGNIDEKKEKGEEAQEVIRGYLLAEGAGKTAVEIEDVLSKKGIGKNTTTTTLKKMREEGEISFTKVGAKKLLYGPKEEKKVIS